MSPVQLILTLLNYVFVTKTYMIRKNMFPLWLIIDKKKIFSYASKNIGSRKIDCLPTLYFAKVIITIIIEHRAKDSNKQQLDSIAFRLLWKIQSGTLLVRRYLRLEPLHVNLDY